MNTFPDIHFKSLLYSAIVCVCAMVAPVRAALAPYEPAKGCYIGAYIELDNMVNGDVREFQRLVGKQHASYFRYVGYGQPFPFRWAKELLEQGIAPQIAWEPNQGLDAVEDNDYLHGWAEAARHAGGPIFLRYASEMNGTWQAYSGNPVQYIDKWRTVYRIMKKTAPNVVMVWCPFATPKSTIQKYYPGDDYVDWVGINIYSVVHQDGDITKPPTEDPVALLKYVYELYADRKPIAICEYGATHFCKAERRETTDFAVNNMTRLYSALPDRFPRVKMINWFSVDAISDNLADNNYSLTANPTVLNAYAGIIRDPYFLSEMQSSRKSEDATGEELITPIAPMPILPTAPPDTVHELAMADIGPVDIDDLWISVIGAPPEAVKGVVEVAIDVPEAVKPSMVTIYIDGDVRCVTNSAPFRYAWNSATTSPGEHIIEVEVEDAQGRTAYRKKVSAIVAEESVN